ncbi:YceI family protein [Antarcticibacterium sp. 1MA-6-2]|uniref:YceI family protein n=1 Tax=Antarcticibacterium sp. 1MA-6-2 TaxID=2908210 RepID=UPI001F3BAA6F|nr:YceI family protein [Antarcticibacterium sp. 1MA-6-2]UJH90340.1 YceI family protein [Antarcticibacterium sp. 1MA-6-2]
MKQVLLLITIAFISSTTLAQTTWKVDPAHTQVSFGITHLGISEVEGKFNKFDGSITTTKDDFSDAQYQMTIEVPSIDTGIEMRDDHLKSPDFFDAEKNQKMIFKSTSSEKAGEGKYRVKGELTFNGFTKPSLLTFGTAEQ